VAGRQRPHLAGLGIDLAAKPFVLDRQLDRRGHRLHEIGMREDGAVVHEGGHRPAAVLEQGHRALASLGRQVGRPAVAIEIPAGRLGPVQNGEAGVAERIAEPPL